jgi:ribosomal-protein-alanine N-acetyltransferase
MSGEEYIITSATEEERLWTAELMAGSEPWISLGITPEQARKFCTDHEYLIYVAHAGGRSCGAMVIHPKGLASSPYLKSLIVEKDFRNHGAGAALLEFAENVFRPSARYFFLCVSSFNTRAMAFYVRHGYTRIGELKDYIIEGHSEILMHKRLR